MSARIKTNAGRKLSELMSESYAGNHARAREGAFVVWIAIMVPVEIFAGFDNVVYSVPESHAAVNASRGVGPLQCEKSEQSGYSMDLCSYARIDMGSAFDNGGGSPVGGLPKPDLLISNNNNCSLLVKWFDVYHRQWGVPHFTLDVPFCYEPQKKKDLDYIINQYHDMIRLISSMSGQVFNPDKTKEAVTLTDHAITQWKRFLGFAAHRPSGITAFDTFVQMAPYFTMRGKPELVEHYSCLADETGEQVRNGTVPVPNESYRLFWDGIAPWHQLRSMSERLEKLEANVIGASYTSCIGTVEGSFDQYEYDGSDPLQYLARIQNSSICPGGMQLRTRAMAKAVTDLSVDGIVFASNRSCKVYSIIQMDQQKEMSNIYSIPTVMIDVDHADERKYSEESAFLRIEALLERIR